MDNEKTVLVPLEILGVVKDEYQGTAYQTLTVRHAGAEVMKLTAKDGADFESYKDKGEVLVECEIRNKAGRLGLRAVGVGTAS